MIGGAGQNGLNQKAEVQGSSLTYYRDGGAARALEAPATRVRARVFGCHATTATRKDNP